MEHSGIYVYNAYIHEYMYDPVFRPRDPPLELVGSPRYSVALGISTYAMHILKSNSLPTTYSYIHTYIHTYIHMLIHTYIHASIHTYIHT